MRQLVFTYDYTSDRPEPPPATAEERELKGYFWAARKVNPICIEIILVSNGKADGIGQGDYSADLTEYNILAPVPMPPAVNEANRQIDAYFNGNTPATQRHTFTIDADDLP